MPELVQISIFGDEKRNEVFKFLEKEFQTKSLKTIHAIKHNTGSEEIVFRSPENAEFNKKLRDLRERLQTNFNIYSTKKHRLELGFDEEGKVTPLIKLLKALSPKVLEFLLKYVLDKVVLINSS